MKKLTFVMLFLILNFCFFCGISNAGCSCSIGSGASFIGNELIADSCPPEGADDNTEYHYINYGIQCSGGSVALYAPWGDTTRSPSFVGNYYASQGLRVLRNPSGTHFIALSKYFKGRINGIHTSGLSAGVHTYEALRNL